MPSSTNVTICGSVPCATPVRGGMPFELAHVGIRALVDARGGGRVDERGDDRVAPSLGAGRRELQHDGVRIAIGDHARQTVGFAVDQPASGVPRDRASARARLTARATRRAMNAASTASRASNVQTRARICDSGENAARAMNAPSAV